MAEAEPDPIAEAGATALQAMRDKAARADQLEEENRRLRIDAAFRDSGLDLNQKQRDAILATYDGDLDVDAVKAAAEALAFVAPPQVPFAEQEAHRRVQEATSGAEPVEAHVVTLNDRINAAKNEEELYGILREAGISVNAEA